MKTNSLLSNNGIWSTSLLSSFSFALLLFPFYIFPFIPIHSLLIKKLFNVISPDYSPAFSAFEIMTSLFLSSSVVSYPFIRVVDLYGAKVRRTAWHHSVGLSFAGTILFVSTWLLVHALGEWLQPTTYNDEMLERNLLFFFPCFLFSSFTILLLYGNYRHRGRKKVRRRLTAL